MTENKRIIKFRGRRRDNGEWAYGLLIYGYNDFCAIRGWMSVSGGQEYATVEVIGETVGEFTGLLDLNKKEIYEGDIVRWYRLEIEWQTHYGDNIPMGQYTEPCGTIATKYELPVLFKDAKFTCRPAPDPEEELPSDYDCPLHFPQDYDRKELDHIFWPRPGGRENERLSDGDFFEVCQSVAEELGFQCASIDDFISKINGFEVIGNLYENPELIKS